jgi:hypothetical protein
MGRRLATPRTALALAVLAFALLAAAIVFSVLNHSVKAGDGGSVVLLTPALGLVGLVVARRAPGNAIGWCLLGMFMFLALDAAVSSYSVLDYRHHDGRLPLGPVAVFLQPAWSPAIVLFALSLLLFPDGKLPSGKWRLPLAAFVVSASVWLVGAYGIAVDAIVSRRIHVDSTGNLVLENHPAGAWAWVGTAQQVFFLLLAAIVLVWLAAQIPAYRRATGVRRAQLKWVLSGAALALVGGALTVSPTSGAIAVIGFVALLALPLSLGIGILRYRLFDIDRLISRTLSYALLTGTLVAVFVGLVLLTTRVLPFSSPIGVAASTLAALALFNPLRGRIQRTVDRRFNRARYDAEATVAAFGARLRDAVDPETVLRELAAAAGGSVQPAHVSVWVRSEA